MKWDKWVGPTNKGPAVMWIKNLIKFRGYRLDLHKMVLPDYEGCHHTHPAKAIRFVLWHGYVEQYVFDQDRNTGAVFCCMRTIKPGHIGVIQPEYAHRIDSLPRGVSYSLWLRWPVTHDVELVGPGWPPQTDRSRAEGFDPWDWPAKGRTGEPVGETVELKTFTESAEVSEEAWKSLRRSK